MRATTLTASHLSLPAADTPTAIMIKGGRGGTKKKSVSKSAEAGLTFPVARIGRALCNMRLAERYGAGGPVYLTAVIEYMAAGVLELAGNTCRENKKKRVSPRATSSSPSATTTSSQQVQVPRRRH